MKERLFLIDGSNYFYRAFYAIKGLSSSKGLPTNAIFGFVNMLTKVIRDNKPDYLVMAFDSPPPTFRHNIYKDYKATRPKMPEELAVQIPYMKRLTRAFNISAIEIPGYEADDIIATITKKAEKEGIEVVIVASDKDLMQLVTQSISIYDALKEKVYNPKAVEEKFAVPPERLIDILALQGDTSDNIPGVKGIGEKTAVKLVNEFGSIEEIYKNIEKIQDENMREKLSQGKDDAFLSKRLLRMENSIDIKVNLEDFRVKTPDYNLLKELYRELDFKKFLQDLPPVKSISYDKYKSILTQDEFDKLIARLENCRKFSLDLETTSREPTKAEIVGVSFGVGDGEAYYIPLGHTYIGAPLNLDKKQALERLKPILESNNLKKIGQNIKYDIIVLRRNGIVLGGIIFDTMLGAYLLNPTRGSHNLDSLSEEYLNHTKISYEELTKRGKKEIPFNEVPIEEAARYSCEDADVTFNLMNIFTSKLNENELLPLFNEIELPLIDVLADMELAGVKIDLNFLAKLSMEFSKNLKEIADSIYGLAGEEFNIDSPKQLQRILFEKLGFKRGRKIKTGYSTDIDFLENLAKEHEIGTKLLQYRALSKLKNGYIDSLPTLVNPHTGRVHTSYNQSVTATGRLSSSDPNLQNIPIKTQEGRLIRKAFVPENGNLLVSADYSQIELRVLAHISQDEVLKRAFFEGKDIHTLTAQEIFNVNANLVSAEMRRKAKIINFGIIYGLSAYGLSDELGIDTSTAQKYIDDFLARYKGVQKYLQDVLEGAKKNGYVATLFGRRRNLPNINSKNGLLRSQAERAGINTPIQGTAADLIKKAMIAVHHRLKNENLKAQIILQVHDELVIETPEVEVGKIKNILKTEMENIHKLDIPLEVSISVGHNWSDMQ